jgi:hypothetical protein
MEKLLEVGQLDTAAGKSQLSRADRHVVQLPIGIMHTLIHTLMANRVQLVLQS